MQSRLDHVRANVKLLLAHRLRRWVNINVALARRLVFAGFSLGNKHLVKVMFKESVLLKY